MKIRTKVFLGYFIAATTALYFLVQWIQDDVRERYLEAVEDNMVDMVNTLAVVCESTIKDEQVDIPKLKEIYKKLNNKTINANIYNIIKSKIDSQIYITDQNGFVLYDSSHTENIGMNFSKWRDVRKTLRGEYGARATRMYKNDPTSLILYVSAPIKHNGKLIGVITLYKPIDILLKFINIAEARIQVNAIFAFFLLLLLGLITSTWITYPIIKLKNYVDTIRKGQKTNMPKIGKGEIGELASSFEELREALEGKKYVENYVQNLTHELKSPLSGIQGALELLKENDIPKKQKEKFLSNIERESSRMSKIVNRMLLLSQLENIKTIHQKTHINLTELLNEIINSLQATNPKLKFIKLFPDQAIEISGDRLLIYEAIDNILKNAIEFTKQDGEIKVYLEENQKYIKLQVTDNGAGIPEYAKNKVFNKFFSLPRPGKNEKSSGLGLSITKEIVELHNGIITIDSYEKNGTTVNIKFKKN